MPGPAMYVPALAMAPAVTRATSTPPKPLPAA